MTLASVYASIGEAGVALVVLAIAGVYLVVRTFFYLKTVRRNFRSEYYRLEKAGPKSFLTRVVNNPALAIVHELAAEDFSRDLDIKGEVSYRFHRNFESVFRSLGWIRFISVVSPLLGLLGTVLGMLTIFKVISHNAAPDAAMLAAGIWEALITTVMGLTVAIPMLMAHYYLKTVTQNCYIQTVECTTRVLRKVRALKEVEDAEEAGTGAEPAAPGTGGARSGPAGEDVSGEDLSKKRDAGASSAMTGVLEGGHA